jgi:hypothetical protein
MNISLHVGTNRAQQPENLDIILDLIKYPVSEKTIEERPLTHHTVTGHAVVAKHMAAGRGVRGGWRVSANWARARRCC